MSGAQDLALREKQELATKEEKTTPGRSGMREGLSGQLEAVGVPYGSRALFRQQTRF
jgi:hypothetical protein